MLAAMSALRSALVALSLGLIACNQESSACPRLGQAFCEAAAVDCEAAKALFVQAELPPAKCEEGIVTLREVLPMLGPDTRGHGLAAFLREVMRDSPRFKAEELDALSLRVGLSVGPGASMGPDLVDDVPQNKFSGYGAVPEPPTPR